MKLEIVIPQEGKNKKKRLRYPQEVEVHLEISLTVLLLSSEVLQVDVAQLECKDEALLRMAYVKKYRNAPNKNTQPLQRQKKYSENSQEILERL